MCILETEPWSTERKRERKPHTRAQWHQQTAGECAYLNTRPTNRGPVMWNAEWQLPNENIPLPLRFWLLFLLWFCLGGL
jgi:hypothetical protein